MAWKNPYQVWLSESDALKNAQIVATHLSKKGWSKEAISALLGNMRHESSVNPNMYEYGFAWEADRGFGLVQWTPRSKYWNWALKNGYSETKLRNGDAQLDRIDYEMKQGIQWISTPNYPESFKTFSKSTKDVAYLTRAFTWNYERPQYDAGVESTPARIAFAKKCLNTLDFSGGGGSDSGGDSDSKPDKPSTGDIKDDLQGFLKNVLSDIKEKIEELTRSNVYDTSGGYFFSNKLMQMEKTYNNTYQMKFTPLFFTELFKDIKIPEIGGGDSGGNTGGDSGDNTGGSSDNSEVNTTYLKPFRRLQQPYGRYFDGNGNKTGNIHRGVDTRMYFETLKSPVKMTITHAGWDNTGYGFCVKGKITSDIKEKGLTLILGHMSKVEVNVGDKVKVGDKLGITGNSGNVFDSTVYNGVHGKGEHVHVELNDSNYNPVDCTKFVWDNCSECKGKRVQYNVMTYLPSVMGKYEKWKDKDPTAFAIYYD